MFLHYSLHGKNIYIVAQLHGKEVPRQHCICLVFVLGNAFLRDEDASDYD